MRSLGEIGWVEDLIQAGLNDCAIARLTGIPRTTVRDWRQERRWVGSRESCAECGHTRHRFEKLGDRYVYLLGLYLGDGHIVHHRRGVYRLSITLDTRYPGIVAECQEAIQAVMPTGCVGLQFRFGGTCASVTNNSKQWPCLFPQRGPGKKHERLFQPLR